MFFYIIIMIVGLGVLLYSSFEISVWGGLYFDRDYLCIERFRKKQKICDALSTLHNVIVSYVGLVLLFGGLIMALHHADIVFYPYLGVGLLLIGVDSLTLNIVSKLCGIDTELTSIKKQWDTQKRVSADNDHEVNMYQGAVRVSRNYLKHNVFYASAIGLASVAYVLTF